MALQWLRQRQKHVLIPLTVVIVITFVFLYGGGSGSSRDRGRGASGRTVVIVSGRKISAGGFLKAKDRIEMVSGRRLSYDVVNPVVNWYLLKKLEVEFSGVDVSDTQLRRELRRFAAMKLGKDDFTNAEYIAYLTQRGTNPQELQQSVREHVAMERLAAILSACARSTSGEKYLSYARSRQKLRVAYVDFPVKKYLKDVEAPTDDELRNMWLADKPLSEERMSIEYFFSSFKDCEEEVQLSEEEVREYYDDYKERYVIREQRQDRDEAGEEGEKEPEKKYKPFEEVRENIEKWLKRDKYQELSRSRVEAASEDYSKAWEQLETGKPDVAAIAAKHNVTVAGLGPATREDMRSVDPFGGASAIVRTVFDPEERPKYRDFFTGVLYTSNGYAAVRVTERIPSRELGFEEARQQLDKRLRASRARDLARKDAGKTLAGILSGERDAKSLKKTGLVSASHRIAGDFLDLAPGQPSDPPVFIEGTSEKEKTESGLWRVGVVLEREAPSKGEFLASGFRRRGTDYRYDGLQARFYSTQWLNGAYRARGGIRPLVDLFRRSEGRRGGGE